MILNMMVGAMLQHFELSNNLWMKCNQSFLSLAADFRGNKRN